MISKIATEIYEKTIQLKKYNSRILLFKKHRSALEKELHHIQELTKNMHCALKENAYSSTEHIELAFFMQEQLAECIMLLTTKEQNYRKTISKYIWGFHNLPRAFLSSDSPISPNEAIEYYKSYMN